MSFLDAHSSFVFTVNNHSTFFKSYCTVMKNNLLAALFFSKKTFCKSVGDQNMNYLFHKFARHALYHSFTIAVQRMNAKESF